MRKQRAKVVRVGVDLAKSVVQVHAVDAGGAVIAAKQLPRAGFLPWCEQLPQGCLVAIEACSAAHHWARRLLAMGIDVRLVAPAFVAPYRMSGKTGKNDANDAAAICEAASRPQMRFVPVKTPDQQSWRAIHTLREGYIIERGSCMNRARGVLAEFGVLFPLSTEKFHNELLGVLRGSDDELTPLARMALRKCLAHFDELEGQIAWCTQQIERHVATDPRAKLAMSVFGVGALTASALVASVGNMNHFKNGRQFSAWLGLVPRMSSTGGRPKLGPITKRGDAYLRKLLVLGGRAVLTAVSRRDDAFSKWAVQLHARVGWSKAIVAIANKNARILWGVLSEGRDRSEDPRH
ncbi:IS110 family transposase [Paucibacter sp. R3-3]|uniref:IS110 family transposase n=1 Tax=Roseateles agri TaxID=3098619 RepID=A0ABU5DTX0_9BURK|nr:IS110 family transposase [Paucibacter sp. R3-3]MDY0748752.1 IS110 family transposase [Paucibacter sp. R3-3]